MHVLLGLDLLNLYRIDYEIDLVFFDFEEHILEQRLLFVQSDLAKRGAESLFLMVDEDDFVVLVELRLADVGAVEQNGLGTAFKVIVSRRHEAEVKSYLVFNLYQTQSVSVLAHEKIR